MRPVPERQAAKAAGEKSYFTGKPCKNGHIARRSTASGCCLLCIRMNCSKWETSREWPPERTKAKEIGSPFYSTGKPCKNGHASKRRVLDGRCAHCAVARARKWTRARPGYEAAAARRRRAKDPTGHRAEVKRWASKNRDHVRAALAAWKAANIEYARAYGAVYQQKRRAHKAKNGGFYTTGDVLALRIKQGGLCAACRKSAKLEVDHIVAVIRGGSNDPINLQLLCRQCNASKGARDMVEWATEHGFVLDV